MHEKILRVLARLAFTVFEAFEFLRETDDVDVEIAQRNPVHIGYPRVVDVVEDIYLFGNLLKQRELILRQFCRFRIQPAHVIPCGMDIQSV